MGTTTKQLSKLLLIAFLTVGACIEKDEKSSSKTEIVAKSKTSINEKLLIGSWLDQSEAKLHFSIIENGHARSDNMKTLLYEKWKLKGTKLILTAKSIGNGTSSIGEEEYAIQKLTKHKLILKIGEYKLEFVRKK